MELSSQETSGGCSAELDPRKRCSNGILGNQSLNLVGPLGLKAHIPRKDSCVHGVPDVPRDSPADRESDSALAELLSESTLACVRLHHLLYPRLILRPNTKQQSFGVQFWAALCRYTKLIRLGIPL